MLSAKTGWHEGVVGVQRIEHDRDNECGVRIASSSNCVREVPLGPEVYIVEKFLGVSRNHRKEKHTSLNVALNFIFPVAAGHYMILVEPNRESGGI